MITESELQGHWQRDWIKAPGFEDTTTRVHWLQAGSFFADLRIPLHRPDVTGLSCLADLDKPALRELLNAEGFAGQITVEDNCCTWHRGINWHGVPERSDIGAMSFNASGRLIEDGVLSEYRELWRSIPQAPLRGAKVSCRNMTGLFIENDDVFLLGIGPTPRGTSAGLIAALDSGIADIAALQHHFASEYVLGAWNGQLGIAELSTNPLHEGQVVLERGNGLVWHNARFDGQKTSQPLAID